MTKYLNEAEKTELLEVLKVADLLEMLVTDAVESALESAVQGAAEKAERDKTIEIAKNALIEGHSIQSIVRITGLDESTVKLLRSELNIE